MTPIGSYWAGQWGLFFARWNFFEAILTILIKENLKSFSAFSLDEL
jgi:hypothetical protein